jgi:hypothetical protein
LTENQFGNELATSEHCQNKTRRSLMDSTQKSLTLTDDEAFAILGLCLTSPGPVDEVAMSAMRKLAEICSQRREPIATTVNDAASLHAS